MMRLTEELMTASVLAPQSVDSGAVVTTATVDVSRAEEAAFVVACGQLAQGKSLTLTLVASATPDGADASQIAQQVLTAEELTDAPLAVVSYKPTALHGRYVAVQISHDSGAALMCGVTAQLRQPVYPVERGWALEA